MSFRKVNSAGLNLPLLIRRCENSSEMNHPRIQNKLNGLQPVPAINSNIVKLGHHRIEDHSRKTRQLSQGYMAYLEQLTNEYCQRPHHSYDRMHSCNENDGEKLIVRGRRPDLRYDERLYFRVKVADLTERSINGNCRAHGRLAEVHDFCGDSNGTCLGCLAIATEAMENYNERRLVPSQLFRKKIPICTCNVVPTNRNCRVRREFGDRLLMTIHRTVEKRMRSDVYNQCTNRHGKN